MAFDQELAERVRAVLATAGQAPTEEKMFGGLSFLPGPYAPPRAAITTTWVLLNTMSPVSGSVNAPGKVTRSIHAFKRRGDRQVVH